MDTGGLVFREAGCKYEKPGKIVTLGPFYPQAQAGAARGLVRESRDGYGTGGAALEQMQSGLEWTRTINALGKDRRWAHRLLFDLLDPLLAAAIAIAVVPAHTAYTVDAPLRELARRLADSSRRVDATCCLERHTPIRQILFGGPSTRPLHRQTIHVLHPELFHGRPVLLLDDIAKSGASLVACRELLSESGASIVQALALGRVVMPPEK